MNQIEYEILTVFKENPESELSTFDIISKAFPSEAEKIKIEINNEYNNKSTTSEGRQSKGKIHRKVLYHLNRLVEDGILKLSREGTKGHKYFVLNIKPGEEVILEKRYKKILLKKPETAGIPLESYQKEGIVKQFEPATWVDRLNSLLLQGWNFEDYNNLFKVISDSFQNINDVVGLDNFEMLLQKQNPEAFGAFIKKLCIECDDYGKKVNIIIDVTHLKKDKLPEIVEEMKIFEEVNPANIEMIFDVSAREFNQNYDLFEQVIDIFSRSKLKLNIKNRDVAETPYLIGKAGVYTFDEADWQLYKKFYKYKLKGIACAQASIAIDVYKYFQQRKSAKEFRDLLLKVAKTLLTVNSLQRMKSEEYFKNLMKLAEPMSKEFFMFSRNYIRLWNYGWKQPQSDPKMMFEMVKSIKEEIKTFCDSEETIYLSCGMPTRFKVAFGPAFREFDKNFSEMQFSRLQINGMDDFRSKEFKEILNAKEELFELFDGGDRIRFLRTGSINAEAIFNEIMTIMNSYKLAFICYDFGSVKGSDLKLTSFLK